MRDIREAVSAFLKTGTHQAALIGGLAGLVVAVLLLTLGFWKTLLIVLCCSLGCFLGGVKDKPAVIRNLLGKLLGRFHSI